MVFKFSPLKYTILSLVICWASLVQAAQMVPDLSVEQEAWISGDVRYIISDAERRFFYDLESDARRSSFIEAFWKVNDPTPLTEENEYRAEHYRRMAEANRRFADDTEVSGSLSRRQVYILLGEPVETVRFDSVDLTSRVEAWRYSPVPVLGIERSFYLLWFKADDDAGYQVFRSGSEPPGRLLRGMGSSAEKDLKRLFNVDPLLGYLALSHFPDAHVPLIYNNRAELRRALARRNHDSLALIAAIADGTDWYGKQRIEAIRTAMNGGSEKEPDDYTPVRADVEQHGFALTTRKGEQQFFISYKIDAHDLALKDYYGKCYGVLIFDITVTRAAGRSTVLNTETKVSVAFPSSDLAGGHAANLIHLAALDLRPGFYRVETEIRNPLDETEVTVSKRYRVPAIDSGELSIGSALFMLEGLKEDNDIFFSSSQEYGLYPSADMVLERGERAWVFIQVGGRLLESRRALMVTYRVSHGSRLLWRSRDVIELDQQTASPVLSHTITFPSGRFPPGDYRLEIEVLTEDGASENTSLDFRIDHRMHASGSVVLAKRSK